MRVYNEGLGAGGSGLCMYLLKGLNCYDETRLFNF